MRIIGIDYGDRRVGIAVCDESESLASANRTLYVSGLNDAARQTAAAAAELKAGLLVLGLPLNMDGSASFRAEKTRRFAALLESEAALPLAFFDERLSTVEASYYLNASNTRGQKRKAVVDALSAEIILQAYLDKKRNAKA